MKLEKFNKSFSWFVSKLFKTYNLKTQKELNDYPELYSQLLNKLRSNYKPYFKNHSIEHLGEYSFSFMFTDDNFKKVKLDTKHQLHTRLVFRVKYKGKLIFRVYTHTKKGILI